MPRKKLTPATGPILSLEERIHVEGVRAMLVDQARSTPTPTATAGERLMQQFLTHFSADSDFDGAVQDFAFAHLRESRAASA